MNRAVVCLIGRPNVGKSTLFNKLARQRISITEDTPGVTRDRIYAEAEWLGKYFTLIDTGGLEPNNEDIFMKNIKLQGELAIDVADVIVFVLDGREGLTGTDREIGEILRRSGKKVLLAVNKLDSGRSSDDIYQFYELGLGEPYEISAEQGLGLGDLLDGITDAFPSNVDTEYDDDLIKVSIVGKPNVGKSSLINKILGEKRVIVTDIPGTTRDAIDTYVTRGDTNYLLIDTAGLRRKRSINEDLERYMVVRTLNAIDRSDIAVLVIDASEGVSEQDAKIAGYAHEQGKAIIIAVNKWDLIEKERNIDKKFNDDIRRVLSFLDYAPIVFISAETGQRIDRLFSLIKRVNDNYNMRVSTGVLNEIISQAVMLNQPSADKGRRPKIFYGTQVSTRPPKFAIFASNSQLIHFSYKRYLENQIRDNFGFFGSPIEIEFRERK